MENLSVFGASFYLDVVCWCVIGYNIQMVKSMEKIIRDSVILTFCSLIHKSGKIWCHLEAVFKNGVFLKTTSKFNYKTIKSKYDTVSYDFFQLILPHEYCVQSHIKSQHLNSWLNNAKFNILSDFLK